MYQCISIIQAKPEGRQTLVDEATKLVEISRPEAGNIYYNLLQNAEDPNMLILIEKWETLDAFLAHVANADQPDDPVGAFGGIVEANSVESKIINCELLV